LIHSVKGQNRANTVLAAWIMWRYKWSLKKTLEFLNSRRPGLNIRPCFIRQLVAFEGRLVAKGFGPKTSNWTEVHDTTNEFENEELLLRNTYLNAQMGPFVNLDGVGVKPYPTRVKWTDSIRMKTPLATVMESTSPNNLPINRNPIPIIKSSPIKVNTDKSPIPKKSITVVKDKKQKDSTLNTKKVTLDPDLKSYTDWNITKHSANPLMKQKDPKTMINNFIEVKGVIEDTDIQSSIIEISKEVPVTQIINQNNVNNYFIQNPKQVQVIEYIQPVNEQIVKKVIPKKTHARPSSADVKRDSIPSSK